MNKYFALRKANRMRTKMLTEKKSGTAQRGNRLSAQCHIRHLWRRSRPERSDRHRDASQ